MCLRKPNLDFYADIGYSLFIDIYIYVYIFT